MTKDKYMQLLSELDERYRVEKSELDHNYFKSVKKRFKVGDFIENVTGVIKVDGISYTICPITYEIELTYIGLRYKKHKGTLTRTKDNRKSYLRDYKQTKKVDSKYYEV